MKKVEELIEKFEDNVCDDTVRAELLSLYTSLQQANTQLEEKVKVLAEENERLKAQVENFKLHVGELLEVATLRGDNDLPHPCNDPKLWTARMQTAWDELNDLMQPDKEEERNIYFNTLCNVMGDEGFQKWLKEQNK
jgi:hypothetical protein